MKRFFGALLLSFTMTLSAQAALLLEPLVGYSLASKVDIEDGESYSGGMGPSFGGRLGYQKLGFQIGLDYLHSEIDQDDKDIKENVSLDEWAAFVGFEFPILFRVYGGYIFSATGETEFAGGNKVDLKSGTGFKAGVGFTLLPFLDINVEYRKGTFDEFKAGAFKSENNIDYNAYMISLSLPFTI